MVSAVGEEYVKMEPRASMDYLGLLQTLLARSAFARDEVDFTHLTPREVKSYLIRLDSLVNYVLPSWRQELFKNLDFTMDDVKAKYVEGLKYWSSGKPKEAREVWSKAMEMADRLRDAVLTLLQEKGILFHSRRVSVYDSSHLYSEG